MKSRTASAILSIAALSSGSLAAFTMDIARAPAGTPKLSRRSLSPRATISESLANNFTGGSYMVTVQVGSPGQTQTLVIDTGSSDVWVLDVASDACTDPQIQDQAENGCSTTYDPSKSSTYKQVVQDGFYIQYGDGTAAEGDYITDDLAIGGATIKSLEMGLAYNATLFNGLLGIGYDTNEASDSSQEQDPFVYPSIIDTMVSQGLINTKAYSLYLNDLQASTGTILFGGIDSDKYHGSLLQVPIVPDTNPSNGSDVYAEFTVALSSFSITGQAGNTTTLTTTSYDAPVILDSGTTLSYVPTRLAESIYNYLSAVDDSQNSGVVFVNCDILTSAPQTTLNFNFGGSNGVTIAVPIDEMIFPLAGLLTSTDGSSSGSLGESSGLPFTDTCALGINGQADEPYILGDSFLRSAYVVYDLKNNVIALAQTNFNSTTSNIVDIQADATAIPNVSGVASSVAVTETATSKLPVGGGHATTTKSGGTVGSTSGVTGTQSSATAGATTSSAAVASVRSLDVSALLVGGLASVLAVLGGGWFLV